MEITKEMVNYVAELSKIRLAPEQTEKMQEEISSIVEYMDILNQIDTSNVEPVSHVFDVKNVLRKDEVKESYDRETLLGNAPKKNEEAFIVPKAVE